MASQDPLPEPPSELVDFLKRVANDLAPGHDQREFKRHHFTVPADVQPLDEEFKPMGASFVAVTRDLSAAGIGLLHTQPVDTRYLQVTIRAEGGPRMLNVEVRRCRSIGKFYDIGGKFVTR